MEWQKPSSALAQILQEAVAPLESQLNVQRKIMFGSPVWMVNSNMFTGVKSDNIFLRLSATDRKEFTEKYPGSSFFEPRKGHIMKEYITVPLSLYQGIDTFRKWLIRSRDYSASLPPKKPGR